MVVFSRKACDLDEVVAIARGIAEKIIALGNEEYRTGGFLTLASRESIVPGWDGVRIIVPQSKILTPFKAKAEKYRLFSLEKPTRLLRLNNERGDISSWQSRDQGFDFYGGAIFDGLYAWGFSGLREVSDDTLVIATAFQCRQLSYEGAMALAHLSENHMILDDPNYWGIAA